MIHIAICVQNAPSEGVLNLWKTRLRTLGKLGLKSMLPVINVAENPPNDGDAEQENYERETVEGAV